MPSSRVRTFFCVLSVLVILAFSSRSQAQAAMLMEEPYGLFGTLNPTGHVAIYFSRLCAETPVKLRRCEPGEPGAVISRYQGIGGYDWVAMPLLPYLYSVGDAADAPERVNHDTVMRLRKQYHDGHMMSLGPKVFEGNFMHGGWSQLVGVSYERKIYAFRFATTEEQDEAIMGRLNDSRNHTEFNLLYNNCADFVRAVMNDYFPHTFTRTVFPDAGMTTPRQITSKLVHYAATHPEAKLAIFAIPQVPGYRHKSHANMSVAGSLMTTGYAIPIAILNPYLAGGLFIDYLVRGRFPRAYEHCPVLAPSQLAELNDAPRFQAPPAGVGLQSRVATAAMLPAGSSADAPVLKEAIGSHE
jgi:hypothetical protein